jgi:hypothetical protein
MMKIKIIAALLLLAVYTVSFADAMPKGYQQYKFNTKIIVDSIQLLESDRNDFSSYDILKARWQYNYVTCNNNQCNFVGHNYKPFQRIIMFSGGKQILSEVYKVEGTNPEFMVDEKSGTYVVTETTGFLFRGITGKILRALIITLFLELLVALYIFGKKLNRWLALLITAVNCISLPIAWLLFEYIIEIYPNPLFLMFILEVCIGLFEYFALKYLIKDKYSTAAIAAFVMMANLVSFIVGGIFYLITTFI